MRGVLHTPEENEIGRDISRMDEIARDRDAGASELLARLLPLLAEAVNHGEAETLAVARVICHGQPAMASLWNACAAAVMEHAIPGRFARVRAEMERAPTALTRAATVAMLDALQGTESPRLLTLSYSGSVVRVLAAVAAQKPIEVICGEGRPRFEGRRMAEALAASASTTLTTDAALTASLDTATAVIVGADAVAAQHWINKVGTRGLAAAAAQRGIPTYVVCTRDKLQSRQLADRWSPSFGPGDEVWDGGPTQIRIDNPYFERIPAELATVFLTDAGTLPPLHLPGATERYGSDIANLISRLT
jgi:translation initiation factor 2B subunit (eIF-2B alpha/beta/delta family)